MMRAVNPLLFGRLGVECSSLMEKPSQTGARVARRLCAVGLFRLAILEVEDSLDVSWPKNNPLGHYRITGKR